MKTPLLNIDPDSTFCAKLFESNTPSMLLCVLDDVLVFLVNVAGLIDAASTKFLNV